jgi:uncharacterized repeat protein (TIGR01451 family)
VIQTRRAIAHTGLALILGLGISLILSLSWGLASRGKSAIAAPDAPTAELHVCLAGPPTCDHSTIQAAVDAAANGDLIKVAAGTYSGVQGRPAPAGYSYSSVVTQVVYVSKTVTIRGGYTTASGFADPPDPVNNPTTLDALGLGRALFIAGEVSSTVSGLHITGGNADGQNGHYMNDAGAGIYVLGASVTIEDNRVTGNTADTGGGIYMASNAAVLRGNEISGNDVGGYGGGLCLSQSGAILDGNTIAGNTAGDRGGGLSLLSSDATLDGNTITLNTAGNEGGGAYLNNSDDAILNGNTIVTNTAASAGGGLYLSSSDATIDNNFITDNRVGPGMGNGCGLYIYASSPLLRHNTIVRGFGDYPKGIYVHGFGSSPSQPVFYNTIIGGHYVGVITYGNAWVWMDGTLWGTGAWENTSSDWGTAGGGTVVTGTVNVWADPGFVNPGALDYHISGGSAAADAGVRLAVVDDVDGEPRPMGLAPDIGADEHARPGVNLRKRPWQTLLNYGDTVSYTLVVTGVGTGPVDSIVLTDELPPEQRVVDSATSQGTCSSTPSPGWGGRYTCDLGTLNVGESARITLTAQVTTTVPPWGLPRELVNSAWVTGTQGVDLATAVVYAQDCHARLNDDPHEWDSVQAAVDASTQPTDVVKVAGYCTEIGQRDGLRQMAYISKTLTLQGGYATDEWTISDPDVNPTTLDAQAQGRGVYITGNVTPMLVGLHIYDGDASGLGGYQATPSGSDAGGGVYVVTATATISGCLISSGDARYGGGLYLYRSSSRLLGNTVNGNAASGSGGGCYLHQSPSELTGNTISNNYATNSGGGLYLYDSDATLDGNVIDRGYAIENDGGGLYLNQSSATLSGNGITFNDAEMGGGGLYLNQSPAILNGNVIDHNRAGSGGGLYLLQSAALLSQSTITNNVADDSGGGLYLLYSDAVLTNTVATANQAGADGGGLHLNYSDPILTNAIVTANQAGSDGGGLHLDHSGATLTNTILAGNQASADGGGIHSQDSSPRLVHTTVAHNSDGNGRGVYISGAGAAVTWTNTIVAGHDHGVFLESGTAIFDATLWDNVLVDFTNNITHTNDYYGDPAFLDLAAGDYHIGPTSAAIDQGLDAGVHHDVDGDPRPQGSGYDLGADETGLLVTKAATPDPVEAGERLTYTIRVANTAGVTLTATITDLLPTYAIPTGVQTWTTVITAPGGIWVQTVGVTVTPGYNGTLTNVVQIATEEGVTGVAIETSRAIGGYLIFLPLVVRDSEP